MKNTSWKYEISRLWPVSVVSGLRWKLRGRFCGSYAQNGEDLFVDDYFEGRVGRYIDIGASHPIRLSNTYLLYKKGWRGVNIEPIPFLFQNLQRNRPLDINLQVAAGESSGEAIFYELYPDVLSTFIKHDVEDLVRRGAAMLVAVHTMRVVTLREIAHLFPIVREVDVMFIDVEGAESSVLRGIDWETMRPRLIMIEISNMLSAGNGIIVQEFIESKGYRLVKTFGCNAAYESARL